MPALRPGGAAWSHAATSIIAKQVRVLAPHVHLFSHGCILSYLPHWLHLTNTTGDNKHGKAGTSLLHAGPGGWHTLHIPRLRSTPNQGYGSQTSARRTVRRDTQAGQCCASDLAQRPGHHVLGLGSAGVAHGGRLAVRVAQEQLHGGAAARRVRACAQASSVRARPPWAVPLHRFSETLSERCCIARRVAHRPAPYAPRRSRRP